MFYKFKPLLKQTLWGGDKIIPFNHLDCQMENVGESWEISCVEGSETICDGDGPDSGLTLTQLVSRHGEALVGKACFDHYGTEFPLLIKFIDARKDLSIQVHPNDEVALRQGHHRGKTEMWYALPSEPGAQLYNGLCQQLTPEEYKQKVADDTICDALAKYSVEEGDVFFIPAGRIHAIGAGCFVAEIQQTSDVTYRIYDFHRRDKDGNLRQLHTEEAAESIDYTVLPDYRTHYDLAADGGRSQVVSCPFFTTMVCDVDGSRHIDYSTLDSFVVVICVRGSGTITTDDGHSTPLLCGDTILLPARTRHIDIKGSLRILETFI